MKLSNSLKSIHVAIGLIPGLFCVPGLFATAHETEVNDPFDALQWRFVGPMRGGRVNGVVGHPTEKAVFYAGYTGGGDWKTEDGGNNWFNISDGQIKKGSIGAIDISITNPDILYVGTGGDRKTFIYPPL